MISRDSDNKNLGPKPTLILLRHIKRRLRVHEKLPYLLVALISLIATLLWYHSGHLIYYADQTFPLDPSLSLKHFFYTWKPENGLGAADATGVAILPFFLVVFVLYSILHNLVVAQAVLFYGILTATGCGMIYVLRYLTKGKELQNPQLALVLAGLFYEGNLYIAISGWRMFVFLCILYAALPWLLVLFSKFVFEGNKKALVGFGVVSGILVSSSYTNIAFLLIVGLILIIFGLCLWTERKAEISFLRLLGRMTNAFALWAALSIWFLLPQFAAAKSSAAKATAGGDFTGSLSILHVISSHASIGNVLTLSGFYPLYDQLGGPWFSWSNIATSTAASLTLFALPVTLIYLFLNYKNYQVTKNILYFSIALIFAGIALAKGSQPPFGGIIEWLIIHVPFPFLIFRAAYEKFGILLALGYSLVIFLALRSSTKSRGELFVKAWLVFAVIISTAPVFLGMIVGQGNSTRPSATIKIPDDYYKAAAVLKSNPQALTLSLPLQPTTWNSSFWDGGKQGYVGGDVLRQLAGTPLISTEEDIPGGEDYLRGLENNLTNSPSDTSRINYLGAHYLVVRKDINTHWAEAYSKKLPAISDLKRSIEDTSQFKKLFESTNLVIYENETTDKKTFVANSALLESNATKSEDRSTFAEISKQLGLPDFVEGLKRYTQSSPKAQLIDLSLPDRKETASITTGWSLYESAPLEEVYAHKAATSITIFAQKSFELKGLPIKGDSHNPEIIKTISTANTKVILNVDNSWVDLPDNQTVDLGSRQSTHKISVFSSPDDKGQQTHNCEKNEKSLTFTPTTLNSEIQVTPRSSMGVACNYINKPVEQNQEYLLSFQAKRAGSGDAGYVVQFNDSKRTTVQRRIKLPKKSAWFTQTESVTSPIGATTATVSAYAYGTDKDSQTNIFYKGLILVKPKLLDIVLNQSSSPQPASLVGTANNINNAVVVNVNVPDEVIDNGSFEKGSWESGVQNCGLLAGGDTGGGIDRVASDGKHGMRLEADGATACIYTGFLANGHRNFKLNLDVKGAVGSKGGYALIFNDPSHTTKKADIPINDASWKHIEDAVSAPLAATGGWLYLYNYAGSSQKLNDIIHYDNASLTTQAKQQGAYFAVNTAQIESPIIESKQLSPTKHSLHAKEIKNSFFLSSTMAYDSGWNLTLKLKNSATPKSLVMNDFRNGWYVDVDKLCKQQKLCTQNADGTYEIEMVAEFIPQRYFYMGSLISGLTLFGCIGYLAYGYLHRRRHAQEAVSRNDRHNI